MRPLRHGYTNDTRSDGVEVVKRYEGPDCEARCQRERAMLAGLRGLLPVPRLLPYVGGEVLLRMEFLGGVPGQDLIEDGHAAAVLRACGQVLRQIHGVDLAQVLAHGSYLPDAVLVHGDFGPNNLLLDRSTFSVTAVLDWEWARPGRPVEDLAWCEWIVRMHHPAHVAALAELFGAYGHRPPWRQRHDAMLAQCQALIALCQRWTPSSAHLWRQRWQTTAAWTEQPHDNTD
jgi:aminoglycoside phosphotransferase (APT) family kinase protein